MELNLITEQRLKEIEARIEDLKRELLRQKSEFDPETILLDSSDLMRWLKISRRTLQHWRSEAQISFIQIDAKIFYTLADVKEFLSKHRREVKN